MDTLMQLVTKGNDFLWSFLLIILLCGTGLYYTIRLRFIQVRKFGEGVRQVFGHFSMNGEKHEKGNTPLEKGLLSFVAFTIFVLNIMLSYKRKSFLDYLF